MSGPSPRTRHLSLRNDLSEITTLAAAIASCAADWQLKEEAAMALNVALEEIVTNVIAYGYTDDREHRIEITLDCNGSSVSARVVDDGRPYDPLARPDPDVTAPLDERPIGGLGVLFVRRLMTEAHYRREGPHNVMVLRKADAR
jgi:anti-sigma regulatory factor (Ser/Thr protein kinase)